MPGEIDPQQTANTEPAGAEPAIAATPESASGTPGEGEPQIPAEPGTEPAANQTQEPEQSQAVKDLIAQRRKRQAAEEKAAYWQGVAESNQRTATPQKVATTGEPQIESYDTYEDYQAAMIDYKVDQRLDTKTKKTQEAEIQAQYNARLQAKPELAEKIQSALLPATTIDGLKKNGAIMAIQESEFGPEIGATIAEDATTATKLSQMTKTQAAKFIGKLEARFETPQKLPEQKKQVTQAPTPIVPTSGKGGSMKDVNTLSVAEHIAHYNDLDRKRGYLKQ